MSRMQMKEPVCCHPWDSYSVYEWAKVHSVLGASVRHSVPISKKQTMSMLKLGSHGRQISCSYSLRENQAGCILSFVSVRARLLSDHHYKPEIWMITITLPYHPTVKRSCLWSFRIPVANPTLRKTARATSRHGTAIWVTVRDDS